MFSNFFHHNRNKACDSIIANNSSSDSYPYFYNEWGERIYACYLSHEHSFSMSRNMYFSQLDYELDIHFYGGIKMKQLVGQPRVRLGFIGESQAIIPQEYQFIYDNRIQLTKDFDYIYTFDERILNEYNNARFFPYAAKPWYRNGIIDSKSDDLFEKKSKNISIIASNKNTTKYHKIRREIAKKCRNLHLADSYGQFDGGTYLAEYDEAFSEYRYAIVIENNISDYYFTEKLTSCFASQTIPIYLGARKIDSFFNSDGIIKINENDIDNINIIVKQCCKEDYYSRREAIYDNYNRVHEYDDRWNWWFRKYGTVLTKKM